MNILFRRKKSQHSPDSLEAMIRQFESGSEQAIPMATLVVLFSHLISKDGESAPLVRDRVRKAIGQACASGKILNLGIGDRKEFPQNSVFLWARAYWGTAAARLPVHLPLTGTATIAFEAKAQIAHMPSDLEECVALLNSARVENLKLCEEVALLKKQLQIAAATCAKYDAIVEKNRSNARGKRSGI